MFVDVSFDGQSAMISTELSSLDKIITSVELSIVFKLFLNLGEAVLQVSVRLVSIALSKSSAQTAVEVGTFLLVPDFTPNNVLCIFAFVNLSVDLTNLILPSQINFPPDDLFDSNFCFNGEPIEL